MLISRTHLQRHWPEVILTLVGLASIAILLCFGQDWGMWAEARSIDPQNSSVVEQRADLLASRARALAGQKGVEAIPQILSQVPLEGPFHFETVLVLTELGPAGVPELVASLAHSDREVRLVALRTLACLAPNLSAQEPILLPALIRLLNDPCNDVRFASVLLLGRLNGSRISAVPALLEALTDARMEPEENPPYLRQSVAYLLGKIGPEASSAVPKLTQLLDDSQGLVHQEAAIALWRITRDTNAVLPHLNRMLASSDPMLHQQAAAVQSRITREMKERAKVIGQAPAAALPRASLGRKVASRGQSESSRD